MALDIGREIGHYRNHPEHNWLAEALRKLQDHANTTLASQSDLTAQIADLKKQIQTLQQQKK